MLALRSPRSALSDMYLERGSPGNRYYQISDSLPMSPRVSTPRFSECRSSPRSLSYGGGLHIPPPPFPPNIMPDRRYSYESVLSRFYDPSATSGRRMEPPCRLASGSDYYLVPKDEPIPREFSPYHQMARRLSSGCEEMGFVPRRYPSDVKVVDSIDDSAFVGPVVTTFGTICLYLEKRIRVDLTLDNSIRVVNATANCKAAIDGRGDTSCLVHPSGSVHQAGTQVQVQTSALRCAKMSSRGITFKTHDSPVVYLLDEGGVKTTVDSFSDLLGDDHSLSVFYGGTERPSDHVGQPEHVAAGLDILRHSATTYRAKSEQVWVINGVRIAQSQLTGDVTVDRDHGRRVIRTSPSKGTIIVITPYLYGCASLPPEAHVFCRRGERRIHGSDSFFSVRNGSQSSGIDEKGRLRIL